MKRWGAEVDANHEDVRDFFRKEKYTVMDTSAFHGGFPDLMVYDRWNDRVVLVEVKDGSKVPSRRKLTGPQVKFFKKFPCAQVVKNLEECRELIWEWELKSKSQLKEYNLELRKHK